MQWNTVTASQRQGHLRRARAQPGCSRKSEALTEWAKLYLKLSSKEPQAAWADIRFEGHSDTIKSMGINRDGKRAVSGSDDKTVRVWDIESGQCIRVFKRPCGWSATIHLSRDGKACALRSFKSIKLWETDTGRCIQTLECDFRTRCCHCCDTRVGLSSHLDGAIRYWNLETGSCIRRVQADHGKASK